MGKTLDSRISDAKSAVNTWHPTKGGKRAWVCFEDSLTSDLGDDIDGACFEALADRMQSGDYYPSDVIEFFGEFRTEKRFLRLGDRIVQRAKLFPKIPSLVIFSVAEIFVSERTDEYCHVGYVTTNKHFGRGIWQAKLTRVGSELELCVESTACPGSLAFWLGLPIARYLQLRARRRAIESFGDQLLQMGCD
jgi:hypothetical protein